MEDTIEAREVRIEGKGMEPHNYKVIDVETGKMMDGVKGIHFTIGVSDPPRVTIEQYHYDGPELNFQALATIKNKDKYFKDSTGRVWLDAAVVAKMIRDGGVMCSRGKDKAVAYEFTEELLNEWEGKKPAPAVG